MAKTAEGKAPVKFLKAGTAHWYGYTAGEFGLVDQKDVDDLVTSGVVQKVDMAEVTKFNAQYEKR